MISYKRVKEIFNPRELRALQQISSYGDMYLNGSKQKVVYDIIASKCFLITEEFFLIKKQICRELEGNEIQHLYKKIFENSKYFSYTAPINFHYLYPISKVIDAIRKIDSQINKK